MSQFYDQASLVVVPSGYKAGTVYAQKPLTTDGQLAFTRTGDTATRVNSAGLIEKVRTNLFLQSNTFSNASWTKYNTTLTSGQSDPFGGTNAWKMEAVISAQADFRQTVSGASQYSIYAKAGNYGFISLWTGSAGVSFDLTNGTAGAGGTITSVGNGWYRCSVATSTTGSVVLIPYFSANAGDFVYIAFAQAEASDVATDYIPTTTAAVSVGPVANVPRLDYLGSTCGKLLLEPQRTNLVTFSEQFNNAAWTKYLGATVTANTITSPDGNINADTLTTSAGQEIYANMGAKAASAITYTFSCFAKYNNAAIFQIVASDFSTSGATGIFNLQTGVATFAQGATWANTSVKMENYGNGWYRCILTSTSPNTTGLYTSLFTATAGSVYIYGMQTEAGAYATSYIPTLAASATRGADACSKTGISSLIGQTEGTLFLDFVYTNLDSNGLIPITIGEDSSNHAYVYIEGNERVNFDFIVAGSDVVSISTAAGFAVKGTRYKIAFAYKANNFAAYINGQLIGTDNSGAIAALSNFYLGYPYASGYSVPNKVNQALLFPTRLSNASLAELTTL